MTDVVILDAVEALNRTIAGRREIVYINQSTTINAPFTGRVIVRAMGAAGGGARGGTYATGGNAGTVAIKELRVSSGDSITLTIPAGGATQTIAGNGNPGGTLSVSAPGWTGSITGGNGGVQGASGNQPAANTAPTGWDAYWLGGRGGANSGSNSATGGGGAALRNGHNAYDAAPALGTGTTHLGGAGIGGSSNSTNASGGGGSFGASVGTSGGPNFLGLTAATGADGPPAGGMGPDISRLLLDLSGGGGSVGKNGAPGGGGGGDSTGSTGGSGGFGGGGGGGYSTVSGAGGQGFVTLEFLETAL